MKSCTITPGGGLPWSQANNTFIFRPIEPRASIYIFVHNLNPTSAHTSQSINVFQSPFGVGDAPDLTKHSSRWTQDSVVQNSTIGASCNNVNAAVETTAGASGLGTCYVNTMFAAQIAIQITGANTQTGSPDNFELAIVQDVAAPGGQQPGTTASLLGTSNSGSAASPALQLISDSLGSAYSASTSVTNPLINANIHEIWQPLSNARGLFFDRVVISCSAACSVTVNYLNASGTTCSNITIQILRLTGVGSPAPLAHSDGSCTVAPTASAAAYSNLSLAAGTTVALDLRGVYVPAGSGGNQGVFVSMAAALTGVVSTTFFWYEK